MINLQPHGSDHNRNEGQLKSSVSASVEFTYVRTDDVGKMALLAAALGAEMSLESDPESHSEIVTFTWRGRLLEHQTAAFLILLSAKDSKTPNDAIEATSKLIAKYGFDLSENIDPLGSIRHQRENRGK